MKNISIIAALFVFFITSTNYIAHAKWNGFKFDRELGVVNVRLDHQLGRIKISFDVTLRKRLTKPQILAIAKVIKSNYPHNKLVFIGYNIEALGTGSGYWATSHWSGNKVNVVISGLTPAQAKEQKQSNGPSIPNGAAKVGHWFKPGRFGGHTVLYRYHGKVFLHHQYPDGSGKSKMMRKKKHRAGSAYHSAGPNFSADYVVINASGNLEWWDGSGRIDHLTETRVK